jgi:hypothetical protein
MKLNTTKVGVCRNGAGLAAHLHQFVGQNKCCARFVSDIGKVNRTDTFKRVYDVSGSRDSNLFRKQHLLNVEFGVV